MGRRAAVLVLTGAVLLLVQTALAPLLQISGVHPDFLLVFVLVVAVRYGPLPGLAAGFGAGLLQDMVSPGFLGLMALAKSSVGFWGGRWNTSRGTSFSVGSWTVFVVVCTLVQEVLTSLFMLQGSDIGLLQHTLTISLPASLYTALLAALWYLAPLPGRRDPLAAATSAGVEQIKEWD